MNPVHWLSRGVLQIGILLFQTAVGSVFACVPTQTPTPFSIDALESAPATTPLSRPTTVVTWPLEAIPTTRSSPVPIPHVPGLTVRPESDAQGNLVAAHYQNSDGASIATFDPQDPSHNSRVTWHWERMNPTERDQALEWIFNPQHMRYSRIENREAWVIHAVTKWIPRMTDFSLPTDSESTAHWQADGPPMSQATLYEALSRIKSLTLVPERWTCNYGHSQLGLIEYGGETILFTAPGWRTVSVETEEISTTVWTIKEAMVIFYAQSLGWASSCPSEVDHLKNEYYSTIWLVKAQQTLSRFVPADKSYWEDLEIPSQIRNIATQTFPRCLPPYFPGSAVTPTVEPCFPIP